VNLVPIPSWSRQYKFAWIVVITNIEYWVLTHHQIHSTTEYPRRVPSIYYYEPLIILHYLHVSARNINIYREKSWQSSYPAFLFNTWNYVFASTYNWESMVIIKEDVLCVCLYVCMFVCLYVYLFGFPHPREQTFYLKLESSLYTITKRLKKAYIILTHR